MNECPEIDIRRGRYYYTLSFKRDHTNEPMMIKISPPWSERKLLLTERLVLEGIRMRNNWHDMQRAKDRLNGLERN